MLKNTLALLAGAIMLTAVTSCGKYDKTENGLEYKIYKDSTGEDYPEKGGFMMFWFRIENDKDSILDNQMKDPNPVGIPVPDVTYTPSIEEGFHLLTEGDSAVFILNADTLYAKTFHQPLPEYIKPGSTIKMFVKMSKVYAKTFVDSVMAVQEQQQEKMATESAAVYAADSLAIQQYMKKKNLKGQATIGGAYVVKLKENKATDVYIAPGDSIRTTYRGTLLSDGSEFDKNPPGEFFTFTVGMGMVIKGWDQGFQKLKRGEKAILLIPSRLAYGPRGAGEKIPPNSPLVFEVEVQK